MTDEGFLRRWARRKAESSPTESRMLEAPADEAPRAAPPLPAPNGAAHAVSTAFALAPDAGASAPAASMQAPGIRTAAAAGGAPSAPARLPTLDDVAQLTADSDFSAFVARGVDAAVRRTALKKLFADPHFNAMDGLDVYIGDYTQPSPVSDAMLASLAHARQVLGRAVDADADADADAASLDEAHPQRQQRPEPGHDDYPPDRRTDDA